MVQCPTTDCRNLLVAGLCHRVNAGQPVKVAPVAPVAVAPKVEPVPSVSFASLQPRVEEPALQAAVALQAAGPLEALAQALRARLPLAASVTRPPAAQRRPTSAGAGPRPDRVRDCRLALPVPLPAAAAGAPGVQPLVTGGGWMWGRTPKGRRINRQRPAHRAGA